MIDKKTLRTWVEIDKKALVYNYRMWRRFIGPSKKLLSVIKSNAYGHGLVDCAKIFSKLGADWLGVDALEEALVLRQAGIKKPILVLGHTRPANFPQAIKHNITITISTFESLDKLKNLEKKMGKGQSLRFHLKINTGMNRQGFLVTDLKKVVSIIKNFKSVKLSGVYSHLASPCLAENDKRTQGQIKTFKQAVQILEDAGYKNLIRHLCATGGTSFFLDDAFDMVRIGIGSYGLWPDSAAQKFVTKKAKWFSLKPVMTWKAVVSEIHGAKKGEAVGYDFTHVFSKDSKLAICAVGYWHGYNRILSNRGYVMIHGKKAPLVGRVSMDMIIIDITNISKVKVGDEATLIGPGVTAYDFAKLSGTSPYEIVTRINPDIPRLYK